MQLQVIETKGQRVLTTKQIAEMYEADIRRINHNFQYNKKKFIEGKHYIVLAGEELKQFKNQCRNSSPVGSRTSTLYLWTEKGALLHAKSINTDKAWEVYDYLVDFYFRVKEECPAAVVKKNKVAPMQQRKVVDIPVNQEAQRMIKELQEDVAGVEATLRLYNRYLPEDDYAKMAYALGQMCMSVADKGLRISMIKPKLIEKA